MTMLTMREMTCLVAIAETLSFSRAAQVLDRSPSAVSRIVKDVEHRLGAELFVRSGKGIWLTPAGEELVRHARRTQCDLEGLAPVVMGECVHLDDIPFVTFSVAADVSPAVTGLVYSRLSEGAEGPRRVGTLVGTSRAGMDHVALGLSVAFLGDAAPPGRGLSSQMLARYRLVLLRPVNAYPEAIVSRPPDLGGATVLVPSKLEDDVRREWGRHGVKVVPWRDDDPVHAAATAVAEGAFILARDPTCGGRDSIFGGPAFEPVPIEVEGIEDAVFLTWPSDDPPIETATVDLIRGELPELLRSRA